MSIRDAVTDRPAPSIQTRAPAGILSEARRLGLVRWLTLGFELGLFLVVVYRFDLESRAFLHLLILAFFGFAVHSLLPRAWRLPFFLALSLAGIATVFGFQLERWSAAGLAEAAWLVGVGVVLVGITYLPLPFRLRVGLVVAAGAGLAAARAGLVEVPWSGAVWPVLGSLFMFRMMVYLYDLAHAKERPSWLESLSYFFLLPNVCFPLFPVVDFKTFRRSRDAGEEPYRTYQTGIQWMFRGAVHLLLYRLAYHHVVIGAAEVQDLGGLVRYLVWPVLLYLRISGQFHIAVGLLRLFGFALPETNHLYFLATSFNDYWRRINIYWKDFMVKVFYYPTFLKLRRLSLAPRMLTATLLVFVCSWLLHSYQWFWLRGSFPLRGIDAVFWLSIGVLVAVNSLVEAKRGKRPPAEERLLSLRTLVVRPLRIAGVFAFMCVAWSFWSADSVAEWLSVWRAAGPLEVSLLRWLPAAAAALVALGLLARAASGWSRWWSRPAAPFWPRAAALVAPVIAVLALVLPQVYPRFGSGARHLVATLERSDLNRRDFQLMERAYYENLLAVDQFNTELWELYRTRPADWVSIQETEVVRETGGVPWYELVPSVAVRHHGAVVRTNRWGMRDRDYSHERPPGVYRMAVLGSSFAMGSGVENQEVFENRVEERLNREGRASPYDRIEILNFAVGGWSPLEHLAILERKVLGFEPHAVLYVAQSDDVVPLLRHVKEMVRRGVESPYPYLEEVARRAGLTPANADDLTISVLEPYAGELERWIYHRIVDDCRRHGVVPVWLYLPKPEAHELGGPPAEEVKRAEKAGFFVLSLGGVWEGQDLGSLWVARWDHHPNAAGHALIADRLVEALGRPRVEAALGLGEPGPELAISETTPFPDRSSLRLPASPEEKP